jgi:hypothetical protein
MRFGGLGFGGGIGFRGSEAAPDVTAPTLSSAVVAADGLSIALTYNETLGASTPSQNDYSLGGTPAVLVSAGRSGAVITLATSQPILVGQTVTVSYTPGVNPVRDVAGNNAAALVAQAVTNSSAATYTAPTVPVAAKCGYFLLGDDIADGSTWAPRADIFSQGNPTIVNGALNASGWVTPEGNRKSITLNGTSAYMRLNALATMLAGDDSAFEYVIWYKKNATTNASNTIAAGSSTSSTTPRKILSFAAGAYVFTHQSTPNNFAHNANNTLQQMVRVCVKNNGSGTDTTLRRNEELDPIDADGTLQANVGTQAINTWTIGAHDNGGSIVNFLNAEIFAIWVRDPAAAPLTEAEGIELHNFVMGAYNTPPLYSSSVDYLLLLNFGQSNSLANGIATGAVAGLPDAQVKEAMRSVNNTAVDPVGLQSLELRGTVHGAQHYIQRGSFAKPHHMAGVGQGATNAGTSWGGQNGAGPTNNLQGYYSTNLPSEVRRNVFMAKARFGGAPSVQCTWWQGENDAAAGSTVAGQYAANLTAIKAYIRRFAAQAFGLTAANIPFHMMKLNPAQTGGGIVLADLNTINAAIDANDTADANAYALSWSDLTGGTYVQGDNLHATAAAMALIGPRFVTSIKAADGTL